MSRKIVPDLVRDQSIAKLNPNSTVREAVTLMDDRHIGCVLVMEGARLVGIFTERDLMRRVVAQQLDPDSTELSAVMTPNPDCIGPNDTSDMALDKMQARGYRHLPVLDGDRVVGVVSIRDLFNVVRRELEDTVAEQQAFVYGTNL